MRFATRTQNRLMVCLSDDELELIGEMKCITDAVLESSIRERISR